MTFQPSEYSAPPAYDGAVQTLGVGLGVGAIVAIIALPTFVVGPFIVKAFKPEWSYGRRLAASMAVGLGIGAVRGIVEAARGTPAVASSTAKAGA